MDLKNNNYYYSYSSETDDGVLSTESQGTRKSTPLRPFSVKDRGLSSKLTNSNRGSAAVFSVVGRVPETRQRTYTSVSSDHTDDQCLQTALKGGSLRTDKPCEPGMPVRWFDDKSSVRSDDKEPRDAGMACLNCEQNRQRRRSVGAKRCTSKL